MRAYDLTSGKVFVDFWGDKRVKIMAVIPVETGIQTRSLPDLGPCVRRDDNRSVFSNCA